MNSSCAVSKHTFLPVLDAPKSVHCSPSDSARLYFDDEPMMFLFC